MMFPAQNFKIKKAKFISHNSDLWVYISQFRVNNSDFFSLTVVSSCRNSDIFFLYIWNARYIQSSVMKL